MRHECAEEETKDIHSINCQTSTACRAFSTTPAVKGLIKQRDLALTACTILLFVGDVPVQSFSNKRPEAAEKCVLKAKQIPEVVTLFYWI